MGWFQIAVLSSVLLLSNGKRTLPFHPYVKQNYLKQSAIGNETQCLNALQKHNPLNSYLKMLDAEGKIEADLSDGNLRWLGSFYECLGVESMHYCVTYNYINIGENLPIIYGTCLPKVCQPSKVVMNYIGEVIKMPMSFNYTITCTNNIHSTSWVSERGLLMSISALLIFICLGIFSGPLYSLISLRRKKSDSATNESTEVLVEQPESNVDAKSRNGLFELMKIYMESYQFKINIAEFSSTPKNDNYLSSFDGIRVFSILWIVLGHTFLTIIYMNIRNPLYFQTLIKSWQFSFIINSMYVVDTFFFLSGFLFAYNLFSYFNRQNGKISVISIFALIFQRYCRLLIPLLIAILTSMYLFPFMGSGPFWELTWRSSYDQCKDYWYTNIFFFNNFYPTQMANNCIGWTWYLANDFQMFLVAIPLLCILYKCKKVGIGLIIVLISGSFLTTTFLFEFFHMSTIITSDSYDDYTDKVYTKPYCRIPAYLVGIYFGQCFYKRRLAGGRTINHCLSVILQIASIAIILGIIFCRYPFYHDEHKTMSKFYNILCETLFRVLWCSAVALLALSCEEYQQSWMALFLRAKVFNPLSKLTYLVYLLHILVLNTLCQNFQTTVDYNFSLVVTIYISGALLTFFLSFLFYVIFEAPIMKTITISLRKLK